MIKSHEFVIQNNFMVNYISDFIAHEQSIYYFASDSITVPLEHGLKT